MISGIVYWEEIMAAVETETGITTLPNYYDKLRTVVLDAEIDIAPSGCIVKKQKDYAIDDGFYDGEYIMLPTDFTGEYYYEKLNTATFFGDRLRLKEVPGPDTVSIRYMGWIFDSKGRPVTTRNHKDAVVARCVWKLYSSKVWQGKGDKNQFAKYGRDYNILVQASRGNDAFPTEEGFAEIGETMNGMSLMELKEYNCGYVSDPDDNSFISGGTPSGGTGSGEDCGELTVDMIAVFESNLTT